MNPPRFLRVLLAVVFCPALILSADAKIERTVEKTFSVSAPGLLRVETHGGSIRVTPGTDATVRVTAKQRINATTEAEADDVLKKLELTLEQKGNDVSVVARCEPRKGWFATFSSWPPVQVDFVISVPAGYATELNTSGGGISVGALEGKALLRTSGGAIKLAQMGGAVDARTSGGSIDLEGARGAVALKTSGGNISVGQAAGPADLATSGGSIKIDSVVGRVRAHTSGGSVRAHIVGPLKDECSLSTSGGSVKVTVDKTAAFQLDAATSGGSVDAAGLTITLEKSNRERSRLAGTVNGGGPLLKLRSSGGGIAVSVN